jgi:hypothetical protein
MSGDTEPSQIGRCDDCGYERAGPTLADNLTQCPKCGSASQTIAASRSDQIAWRESWRAQVRDGSLPSKRRLRRDIFTGADQRKSHGDFVHKERVIDKDTDRYRELVRTESGEIIHEVDESLTDHFGHGSAKFKKNQSEHGGAP